MNLKSLFPFSGLATGRPDDNPFHSLQREMNRLFEDRLRSLAWPSASGGNGRAELSIDLKETEKTVEVTAELPGVEEKDVEVTLKDGVLTIKGEKRAEKTEEKEGYHLMERTYGSFLRSFPLPCEVEAEKVSAEFSKGVLKIVCPKAAEAVANARKIAIKSAA